MRSAQTTIHCVDIAQMYLAFIAVTSTGDQLATSLKKGDIKAPFGQIQCNQYAGQASSNDSNSHSNKPSSMKTLCRSKPTKAPNDLC